MKWQQKPPKSRGGWVISGQAGSLAIGRLQASALQRPLLATITSVRAAPGKRDDVKESKALLFHFFSCIFFVVFFFFL